MRGQTEFASRIQINEKMAKCICDASSYLYSIYEGSAQCGKSVTAALAFALLIEASPKEDNLFIALGYTQSSVINNVFACNGFGLLNYFGSAAKMEKYKGPDGKLNTAIDCLKIKTANGTKIVVPFGTNTRTANNAWHGWRVAGFLIDEADRACQESLDEAKQRITTVENPHIIMTMNPPLPTHPICAWIDDLVSRGICNHVRWTLDDNVALSPEKIADIKSQYDPTSVYYKRYVLGQRCGADSLIYKLSEYNFIEDFETSNYISYVISMDPGETVSASSITLGALRKGFKGVDILKDYYHRNKDGINRTNQKTNTEYAKDLADFVESAIERFGKLPECLILDNGAAFLKDVREEFSKRSRLRSVTIKYPQKVEIEERIKRSSSLLYKGRLRFCKKCAKTIEAFQVVYADEKELQKGRLVYHDAPEEGTMCDPVDSVCYIVAFYDKDLMRTVYDVHDEM